MPHKDAILKLKDIERGKYILYKLLMMAVLLLDKDRRRRKAAVALGVGFEPTHDFTRLSVFKTDPFNLLGIPAY